MSQEQRKEYTQKDVAAAEQRLFQDEHMKELMSQLGQQYQMNQPVNMAVGYDGRVKAFYSKVVTGLMTALRGQLKMEVLENYPELAFVYQMQEMQQQGLVIPEGVPHYWRDPEVDKPGLGEYLIIDSEGGYAVKAISYPGDTWQYSDSGREVKKVLRYQPVPVMDPALASLFPNAQQ